MHKAENSRIVHEADSFASFTSQAGEQDKTRQVNRFIIVVNDFQEVVGTITGGDIRRFFEQTEFEEIDLKKVMALNVMNRNFVSLSFGMTKLQMAESIIDQLTLRGSSGDFPFDYIPIVNAAKKLEYVIHFSELTQIMEDLTRQVVVIGQGFVGLTFSMAMVNCGLSIFAVEKDKTLVDNIKNLQPPIHEPRLGEILQRHLDTKYQISSDGISSFKRPTVMGKRIYVIAVGTPFIEGAVVLDAIYEASAEIAKDLQHGDLIILLSLIHI